MSQFGVTMKVKNLFFDRKAVEQEIGKDTARALSKIGAFVRRRAIGSLRRRKKISAPGTPPSVHSKDKFASLKNILFAYDRERQSVVIGPVKLNQVNLSPFGLGNLTVPHLHEFGGAIAIQEVSTDRGRTWRRRDLRRGQKPWMQFRTRQAQYPSRPFMGPALAAEAPKFPSLWVSQAGGRAA